MKTRIAVFGAGGIGGFLAGALARAGCEVCLVARGAHLDAIQAGGLRIRSGLGAFTARVPAFGDLRDAPPVDYVLLTFKSHQWLGVLDQLADAVARGSVFVTLQNGLPFWYWRDRALQAVDPGGRVRAAIPYEQVIGGVVHASGRVVEPGLIEHSGNMLYPLGEPDGAISERLQILAQSFTEAGLQAPMEAQIRRRIWLKVVNNAALNPVSALTRASMGTMLRDPRVRELLRAVIAEGLDVARASGVEPQTDADERLQWADRVADVKTSMLQDLEAGRPLELEPILGALIECAQHGGVAVSNARAVYALARLLSA